VLPWVVHLTLHERFVFSSNCNSRTEWPPLQFCNGRLRLPVRHPVALSAFRAGTTASGVVFFFRGLVVHSGLSRAAPQLLVSAQQTLTSLFTMWTIDLHTQPLLHNRSREPSTHHVTPVTVATTILGTQPKAFESLREE